MPEIAPNCWKAALSFFWWREYRDGRQEQEFDLLTGQISPWGSKTPEGLSKVGWLPVTPSLAQKMASCGEYGVPTPAPAVIVPVSEGEEPIIYKEHTVWDGLQVHCKACGAVFRSRGSCSACVVCGETTIETQPSKWEETEYFLGIKGKFCDRFNGYRLITEHY